jgi:hypothetical protein
MKATVLSVQYDFGGYEPERSPRSGRKIASLMNVEVQVGKKREFARVDRFFKERLGLLTQARREQIFSTMPKEVNLEIVKTVTKNKHIYGITEVDLEQWHRRIEQG